MTEVVSITIRTTGGKEGARDIKALERELQELKRATDSLNRSSQQGVADGRRVREHYKQWKSEMSGFHRAMFEVSKHLVIGYGLKKLFDEFRAGAPHVRQAAGWLRAYAAQAGIAAGAQNVLNRAMAQAQRAGGAAAAMAAPTLARYAGFPLTSAYYQRMAGQSWGSIATNTAGLYGRMAGADALRGASAGLRGMSSAAMAGGQLGGAAVGAASSFFSRQGAYIGAARSAGMGPMAIAGGMGAAALADLTHKFKAAGSAASDAWREIARGAPILASIQTAIQGTNWRKHAGRFAEGAAIGTMASGGNPLVGMVEGLGEVGLGVGHDKVSATLKRWKGEFDGFKTKAVDAAQGVKTFVTTMGQLAGLAVVTLVLTGLGLAMSKLAKAGAEVAPVALAFENLSKIAGAGATEALERLRAASRDTVPDLELMKSAVLALNSGAISTIEDLEEISQAAKILGRTVGLDTATAVQNLVRGIGLVNPELIKSIGVLVSAEEAYRNYAAANNMAVSALSDHDKHEAFRILTMEKVRAAVDRVSTGYLTNADAASEMGRQAQNAMDILDSFQRIQATRANMWRNIGMGAAASPSLRTTMGSIESAQRFLGGPAGQKIGYGLTELPFRGLVGAGRSLRGDFSPRGMAMRAFESGLEFGRSLLSPMRRLANELNIIVTESERAGTLAGRLADTWKRMNERSMTPPLQAGISFGGFARPAWSMFQGGAEALLKGKGWRPGDVFGRDPAAMVQPGVQGFSALADRAASLRQQKQQAGFDSALYRQLADAEHAIRGASEAWQGFDDAARAASAAEIAAGTELRAILPLLTTLRTKAFGAAAGVTLNTEAMYELGRSLAEVPKEIVDLNLQLRANRQEYEALNPAAHDFEVRQAALAVRAQELAEALALVNRQAKENRSLVGNFLDTQIGELMTGMGPEIARGSIGAPFRPAVTKGVGRNIVPQATVPAAVLAAQATFAAQVANPFAELPSNWSQVIQILKDYEEAQAKLNDALQEGADKSTQAAIVGINAVGALAQAWIQGSENMAAIGVQSLGSTAGQLLSLGGQPVIGAVVSTLGGILGSLLGEKSDPVSVRIEEFSQRAVLQQRASLEQASKIVLQLVGADGRTIETMEYELGRRERRDAVTRIPTKVTPYYG